MREELGTEKANSIVYKSLHNWNRQLYLKYANSIEGSTLKKWQKISLVLMQKLGNDVEMEWIKKERTLQFFNIVSCKFVDFFLEFNEPILGSILCCEIDNHVAESFGEEITFTRNQTIMKGASFCDFRYNISLKKEN